MMMMMMMIGEFNIPIIKSNSCFPAAHCQSTLGPWDAGQYDDDDDDDDDDGWWWWMMTMMMMTMMMMDDAGDDDDVDDGYGDGDGDMTMITGTEERLIQRQI